MKILVIYNPEAGGGRARGLLDKIKAYCDDLELSAEFMLTQYSGHAVILASQAKLENYDALIASGGDGTLYEVVNGYYLNKSRLKPPIGLIPNGTGNAFMKELGLAKNDWRRALDIIQANQIRMIDVARYAADDQLRYFINIMGLGFVADVAKATTPIKWLGNSAYTIATLWKILSLKAKQVTCVIDDQSQEYQAVFIEVANSRYTGTKFLMAPNAKLDDGKLDIIILKKIGRLRLLSLFQSIYSGKHIHYPQVDYLQASKIAIKESQPGQLVPDGEILGRSPVSIECLQRNLAFIWPKQ